MDKETARRVCRKNTLKFVSNAFCPEIKGPCVPSCVCLKKAIILPILDKDSKEEWEATNASCANIKIMKQEITITQVEPKINFNNPS